MARLIDRSLDTPWKIWNEMWRWLAYPWIRLLFALNGVPWGRGWRFYGVPIIQRHRRSSMRFGTGLQLRSSARSNPLGTGHPVILTTWQAGATLQIGASFAMTGGSICAGERIVIGDHVVVGANSTILDSDFHPIDPQVRWQTPNAAATLPVTIEDNVFIGMNCLILKGVTIGHDSVIGAGSIVTKDVPPGTVAAGNPAQAIGPVTSPVVT